MSADQEKKIREELEMDVERDLEEEIKDEIYRLALKLHRLYQHQKERNSNPSSSTYHHQDQKKPKLLSEININIKMEGGTTIQINEIKKVAEGISSSSSASKHSPNVNVQGKIFAGTRRVKFDWERSLRSGSSSSPFNITSNHNILQNEVHGKLARNGSVKEKVDIGKKIARRELGWKD